MDEEQWLRCGDPDPMLAFLGVRASDRQRRLFVLAWVRGSLHWLLGWPLSNAPPTDVRLQVMAVAERLVRGRATDAEREAAYRAASDRAARPLTNEGWAYAATLAAATVAPRPGHVPDPPGYEARAGLLAAGHAAQADLLREVVGNPFRAPRGGAAWRAWGGGEVVRLARLVDEGAFDLLPVLGDALEEAGCEQAELLGDCRRPLPPTDGPVPGLGAVFGSIARELRNVVHLHRAPPLGPYEGPARACRIAAAVLGRFDSLRLA